MDILGEAAILDISLIRFLVTKDDWPTVDP